MISDRKAFFMVLTGLFVPVLAASCLGVSPIVVGSTSNASNQSRECAACYAAPDLPGPGCADEVTACAADPRCDSALLCSLQRGCFQGAREQLITCGSQCASEAGFTSLDDKSIGLATRFYACLLDACKDPCFGAVGAGSDASGDATLGASTDAGAVPGEASDRCGAADTKNNELDLGGYCTTTGDCASALGLRFCAAEFGGGHFCTGLCTDDRECGTGVYCAHTAQGSGCVPIVCRESSDAGPD